MSRIRRRLSVRGHSRYREALVLNELPATGRGCWCAPGPTTPRAPSGSSPCPRPGRRHLRSGHATGDRQARRIPRADRTIAAKTRAPSPVRDRSNGPPLRMSRSVTNDGDLLSLRYPLAGCPFRRRKASNFRPQRSARREVQAALLAEPSWVEPSHLDVPHRGMSGCLGISIRGGGFRFAWLAVHEARRVRCGRPLLLDG
jgi:hypothetical protein